MHYKVLFTQNRLEGITTVAYRKLWLTYTLCRCVCESRMPEFVSLFNVLHAKEQGIIPSKQIPSIKGKRIHQNHGE